eukprot:m.22967 g.22967  ORF g.22967 m.22967 type:complete len:823 (+) comp3832_c0_seq1:79-2547(+)
MAEVVLHAAARDPSKDGEIRIDGDRRTVTLHANYIEIHGRKLRRIPITEIIAVEDIAAGPLPWAYRVAILTFKRVGSAAGLWRPRRILLKFARLETAQLWRSALVEAMRKDLARPRVLRVFINPMAGSRAALAAFKRIRPLFELAKVSLQPVVTTRHHHALEAVEEMDLSSVDGIVAVGGDGLFHELVAGMLNRADSARCPIGVLPAGSTDTVAYSTMGTNDLFTAAAHIIIGDHHAMDAARVTFNTGRTTIASNFISHGYFADTLKKSEHSRWMGTSRYSWAGFKSLASGKARNASIKYTGRAAAELDQSDYGPRTDGHHDDDDDYVDSDDEGEPGYLDNLASQSPTGVVENDAPGCHTGDKFCRPVQTRVVHEEPADMDAAAVADGDFSAICIALMSLRNAKAPSGLTPLKHLADGVMDLITVAKCSRVHFLRFLTHVAVKNWDPFNLDGVQRHPCVAVSIETGNDHASWNVDGELFVAAGVQVQVLPAAYTVYARGIEVGGPAVRAPRHRSLKCEPGSASTSGVDSTPGLTSPPPAPSPPQCVDEALSVTGLLTMCDADAGPDDLAATIDGGTSTDGLVTMADVATGPDGPTLVTTGTECAVQQATAAVQADPLTTACQATQTEPQRNIFSVPTQGRCYAGLCRASNGEFCCYSPTCPNRYQYPVHILPQLPRLPDSPVSDSSSTSHEDTWHRRYPGLMDPFEVVEGYITSRHFRLLDFFHALSFRRPSLAVDDFRARATELALGLCDVQLDELVYRLDRNSDGIITYRDLASCRRRYTLRLKSIDPAWRKVMAPKDDLGLFKDTFVLTPSPRHVYPAI